MKEKGLELNGTHDLLVSVLTMVIYGGENIIP
jgi:hypothetical protein